MKFKLMILLVIAVILIGVFMFIDVGGYWDYVIPRRGKKVLAIILTGGSIGVSTIIFQTITNNRILTPSVIGLDSLYMLIQTVVVFVFGASTLTMMNSNVHFLLSVGMMMVFAMVLYKFLFKKEGQNIYFLLLVGIILGTLFSSISSFMEILIDPNEFLVVQDSMFASFNNVNTRLLLISCIMVAVVGLYFTRYIKVLDVISLGKHHSINLGIDYNSVVKKLLIIVAILVSISTALVGPITFLGLLVANITYQFLGTYKHSFLLLGSIFISIIALVGGELLVERVLNFTTTVSVIINLFGGCYFLYLLIRENKSW